MIRLEYQRFLQTFNNDSVSTDVRKMANLVLQHLNELIPLSSAKGQRVKKMVKLAQKNWEAESAEIQPVPELMTEQTAPLTQLKSMAVGPFRGFAKQEVFDLDSHLILIYGPNGTGKSSFCEALEYCLLGNVSESEIKRFHNLIDYLRNAYTDAFKIPILIGVDSQGQDVQILASEVLYRFCFIEKNRIDSFSRIAAQAPAKQTELISTLFGLDAFSEFVRNFTAEIDGKYIDIEGIKAKELKDKRLALAGYKQQIETYPEELTNLGDEENKLASQYREGMTFAFMVYELNGDEEKPGFIKKLDAELIQPIESRSNLTISALQELKESINSRLKNLSTKQKALNEACQQVSFKQLYDTIAQVQQSSLNHCPACLTPLTQVAINPYIHAREEQQKLKYLSDLQGSAEKLNDIIEKLLTELLHIINTCCTHFPEENRLSWCQIPQEGSANIEWWDTLHLQQQDGFTPWHHLEVQVKQLEGKDKAIDELSQQRTEKKAHLEQLRKFAEKIVKLKVSVE